jgi:hypothetical protein
MERKYGGHPIQEISLLIVADAHFQKTILAVSMFAGTLSCGAIIGHTIRQALPRHVGMLLSDVISGIVGIEIFEQQRRAAVIRGHRTVLIAQDLSIEIVDESVHGARIGCCSHSRRK